MLGRIEFFFAPRPRVHQSLSTFNYLSTVLDDSSHLVAVNKHNTLEQVSLLGMLCTNLYICHYPKYDKLITLSSYPSLKDVSRNICFYCLFHCFRYLTARGNVCSSCNICFRLGILFLPIVLILWSFLINGNNYNISIVFTCLDCVVF